MASAVARPARLLVGGADFSKNFISYSGARSTTDTSGLLSISGQITLQYIPGLTPESLDDRSNPERWHRGQKITIEIGNESGGWDRFPHGALRIIEAEFDGRGQLLLKVGDLIAYNSFKEPTDYRDAGIEPPAYSLVGVIANRLLAKMGMPSLSDSLGSLKINYPINVGDNYWSTIGQLAFSAGRYVYVDRYEKIRVARLVTQPGAAALSFTIGADEIEYSRLTGAQKPPEKVIVTGTRKIVSDYTDYSVSVTEEYGPAFLLGGESSAPVLLSQTKVTDEWQPEDDRRRITTERREPRKAVNPGEDFSETALVRSLVQVDDYIYEEEGNGDEDKGKLLRIESESRAPRIIAIAPYEDGWENNPYILEDYQTQTTQFQYSPEEQTTQSRRVTLSETAANIATSEDWSQKPFSAYILHPSEDTLTEWFETIPEMEWEETISIRKAVEKAGNEGQTIPDDLSLPARLALITTKRDRRTSNNGVRPPAPDRRPPRYSLVEKAFRHEVSLPQKGGNYRERSVTLNVPFLPGEVGSVVSLNRRRKVVSFNRLAWPKYLGKLFGALLIGKHKGSEIDLPYQDSLTAIEPLSVIDVTEDLFDGSQVTRRFLVDGDAYALTRDENRCGFDLIWMGDHTGISSTVQITNPDGSTETATVDLVDPPFQQPTELESYGSSAAIWRSLPYGVDAGTQAIKSYSSSAAIWTNTVTSSDTSVQQTGQKPNTEEEINMSINGQIICTSNAPKTNVGKAIEIYGPAGPSTPNFVVEIGYEMEGRIEVGIDAIEISRWATEPDANDLSGREWVGVLPETGGVIAVPLGSKNSNGDIYRYITIAAKNSGIYDHVFLSFNGLNRITLVDF